MQNTSAAKKILIHFLLYLASCFIGVLQFGILITLVFLLGNEGGSISFAIAFFAMLVAPIVGLPLYLIFIVVITVKKITNPNAYIIGGMFTAASLPISTILFSRTDNYLGLIISAILLSLFGIIPGKIYYKSCKKYFFDK
jgi:hypothetical protein